MPQAQANPESYHPIIYIRGFAMNQSDIDETTADPFCGFNVGSTVFRARPSPSPPARFVFESPVMRLVSDHGYANVITQGTDLTTPGFNAPIPRRSVVVHHYYDQASALLGDGRVPPIDKFAQDLASLIERMQALVIVGPDGYQSREDFRCYLVAHSMGGLVARAFLQNRAFDPNNLYKKVLKLFTYATPHNGIDVLGMNVPSFLRTHEIDTFSRGTMSKYLNLVQRYKATESVAWMPQECLAASKIFTFIGTNRQDYEVAFGLSRTFVGKGSDGLVKIQNADLAGYDNAGIVEPCAKAFAFRSHSGFFGIVNSEEGYQNLQRFLFGTYRVDVWLDVNDVKLPPGKLADADANGTLDATYPVEVLISLRNKPWYLTRRVAVEDSAAVFEHKALREAGGRTPAVQKLLSTVFMADWGKRNPNDPTVAYRLQLSVLMPDFQVSGADASEGQYEGSKIFSGAVIIVLTTDTVPWTAKYYWESDAPGSTAPPVQRDLALTPVGPAGSGKFSATVQVSSGHPVNLDAQVRFEISAWQ
ncbi:hypothetical protein AWB78_08159 [Caballeronia calidae]|uniref:GPI inositol-deacylase PGAP1-like alpha/beta domain-containing protein n=1 Tax=Caballeronia calidae TaxID=1777139 RepID=A0A158EL26_9BURK|nr:hypothetical protein [Caballeronia calidae]SAL06627.1 hypothetical protein AWB78_08159 [Caballeronia calidae]